VISTPTGARGLDIKNYEDAIICEITDIPQKIQELLDSQEAYIRLSEKGRFLVQKTYDWDIIAGKMVNILENKLQEQ
jgi:glycosyltransferase involved in cell wall biosynthesis